MMIMVSSCWLTGLLCFTMILQSQCFPERATSTKNEIATETVLWNTQHSPYANVTGVLSNGNESLIVRMGSQLDLWRLQGSGYVLQKNCQLEGGIRHIDVFPNSNIVCYINKSYALILYNVTSCNTFFTKPFDRYHVAGVKTTKDLVLIETQDRNAQLFSWNGSNLKHLVTFSRFFRDIHLSQNGVIAYRKSSDERQTLRYFNTTSRHSIKMRTGFEFDSYRLSPEGRYAVLSSEDWKYVAVYDLATNRLVFNGSVELLGSVRRVLMDDDRLYIFFSIGYKKFTDMTIAYIDISASLENFDNRNLTFTAVDLGPRSVFAQNVDFRRINGTSYLQIVCRWGEMYFYKLDSDGQTWVPLQ